MPNPKLSKQQKLILVALADLEVHSLELYQALVLTVTGINPNKYGTLHGVLEQGARKQCGKAYATMSRSIARLIERGLVGWEFDNLKIRYLAITSEGKLAVKELCPLERETMSAKVSKINAIYKDAVRENAKVLKTNLERITKALGR